GLIGAHSSLVWLSLWMFMRGIGIGFAFMPAIAAAFAALEPSELSDATPQMNVLQRLGGSIGTAVLAVVLQRALISAHHPLTPAGVAGAYSPAVWWSLGITALAVLSLALVVGAVGTADAKKKKKPASLSLTVTPNHVKVGQKYTAELKGYSGRFSKLGVDGHSSPCASTKQAENQTHSIYTHVVG